MPILTHGELTLEVLPTKGLCSLSRAPGGDPFPLQAEEVRWLAVVAMPWAAYILAPPPRPSEASGSLPAR